MKKLFYELDEDDCICLTPCPVRKDIMVGSITCQACLYNDYKKINQVEHFVICKAVKEEIEK